MEAPGEGVAQAITGVIRVTRVSEARNFMGGRYGMWPSSGTGRPLLYHYSGEKRGKGRVLRLNSGRIAA
jgi:hypothetical protein